MLALICKIVINMTTTTSNLPIQVCCFGNSKSTMALQLVTWIFQNGELLIKFHTKQLQLRNWIKRNFISEKSEHILRWSWFLGQLCVSSYMNFWGTGKCCGVKDNSSKSLALQDGIPDPYPPKLIPIISTTSLKEQYLLHWEPLIQKIQIYYTK